MNKSKVLIWRYGNKEPDECPMVISHASEELPKFIKLASFEHSNLLYFKLIDLIIGGHPVYYETFWSSQP